MPAKLSEIIRIIEGIAPPGFAEKWDNPGLQVGNKDWEVSKVWIALDPLPQVVTAACGQDVDLLITHHPLLLKSIQNIDFSTPLGTIIQQAADKKLAIYSAHTNLDIVAGGLNDIFAKRIGLKGIKNLLDFVKSDYCKLVFFVPPEFEERLLEALFETGAGVIDTYTCCSFRNSGRGTFKAQPGAKPFSGDIGSISDVEEIKIESVIPRSDVKKAVDHLRKNHPYETMAYDIFPLDACESRHGLGRIGELEEPVSLKSFAEMLKKELSLYSIKFAGRPDLSVKKVAVCTGSGSSLLNEFFSSGADIYISGDMRYHDARTVEAKGLGLIDIGHFNSEILIVEELTARLQKVFSEMNLDVTVVSNQMEEDPFTTL